MTIIERLLVGLALVVALVYGAFLYGCDHTRNEIVSAQMRHDVAVIKHQKTEVIRTVIRYITVKERHDAALPALARDIVRQCLLPAGAAVQSAPGDPVMPGHGAGTLGPDPAPADEAGRAWCEQLAQDYAAGVHNWDALEFALGWIRANGGAPAD